MKRIREMLIGGDLRSIGKADAVVRRVLRDPELVSELFAMLSDDERLVRMRAADALEKATRKHPEWLQRFKRALLDNLAHREEKELRWHVAQLLPRLDLSPAEKEQAVRILTEYLRDSSSIVKTFSMQALADLAMNDEHLQAEVRPLIERLAQTGTAAMRSRGRKLLQQFRKQQ